MDDLEETMLRPFEPADAAAVRALFLRVHHEIAPSGFKPHLQSRISEVLAGDYSDIPAHYEPGRGRGFWVVVAGNGDLLGNYALLPKPGDAAELRRFYVSPTVRGKGIARLMLADAERRCRDWGILRLGLTTSELHVAALKLYQRAGYEETQTAVVDLDGVKLRVFGYEKRLAPAIAA
jgi:GNAT superfamily N-acetyltransferase